MKELRLIKPSLCPYENIKIFTTTREGGVSTGPYSGLNLGMHVGDDENAVMQNRRRVAEYLESLRTEKKAEKLVSSIIYLNQTHSTNVFPIGRARLNHRQECDGCFTDEENEPVAVMTADCLPIILTDGIRLAAVHAGWKGLANGIIQNALNCFANPSKIYAYIAPAISQKNYQVDHSLENEFLEYQDAFASSSSHNKRQFSLATVATVILRESGIKKVEINHTCTYENDLLYSHRKSTHQGQSQTGRMITLAIKTFDLD